MNSDSDQLDPQSDPKPNAIAPITKEAKDERPKKRALGEIFSRAFQIYRDNPIMIVPSLIPIAALVLVMVIFAGYMGLVAVLGEGEFIAFSALAEGMTIEMIREASSGNKADLSYAWQATLAKMEPLVLTSLAIGSVLPTIPFIGALASLLSLPYIYGLATLLYLDGKEAQEDRSKTPKTTVEVSL